MKSITYPCIAALVGLAAACAAPSGEEPAESSEDELTLRDMLGSARNAAGAATTISSAGGVDRSNAFFQELGTNGRTCESCHVEREGWSISPKGLQERFDASDGTHPVFRVHDGATSPNADVSTVEARREAYKLLLSRGLIRVGLPVKATSEFTLVAVDDPYGHASAAQLSMFRRPLPTTNLRFIAAVNWDGRNNNAAPDDVHQGLGNQINGGTINHAKATAAPDDATRESIIAFETGLATAQTWHDEALLLTAGGATAGPDALLTQPFSLGMNDPSEPGAREVFTLFDAWAKSSVRSRRAIAAGQRVFNEKTFDTGNGRTGTCSGCHNTPNVGSASSYRFFDVGISDPSRRTSDIPLYTFENIATGERLQTTDAGRALISGKWSDMNRFKVPGLRGLASHAPYFHDGSARTIAAVVDHYQRRFQIQFEGSERSDLVRFLEAL